MKNKIKILFVIFTVALVFSYENVNASRGYYSSNVNLNVDINNIIKIGKEEISSGKYDGYYIIGTHMFSYDGNESYNGILKTEHIMFAAMTIGNDSLVPTIPSIKDMKVYYIDKTKVTDAFTGEEFKDYNFNIDYKDLVKIDNNIVDSSIYTIEISKSDDMNFIDYPKDVAYGLEFSNNEEDIYFDSVDYIQIASSFSKNGIYENEFIDSIHWGYYDQVLPVTLNFGETRYFKARACKEKETNKYTCGDWSNVISYTAELPTPTIKKVGNIITNDEYYEQISSNFDYMSNPKLFVEYFKSKSYNLNYDYYDKVNTEVIKTYILKKTVDDIEEFNQEEYDEKSIGLVYNKCDITNGMLPCVEVNQKYNNISKIKLEEDEYSYIKSRVCMTENGEKKCGKYSNYIPVYNVVSEYLQDSFIIRLEEKYSVPEVGFFLKYSAWKDNFNGTYSTNAQMAFDFELYEYDSDLNIKTPISPEFYDINYNDININYSKISDIRKPIYVRARAIYESDGKISHSNWTAPLEVYNSPIK